MTPPLWQLWEGATLKRLGDIPDGTIQCVVTSPPYFGLRDYGLAPTSWGDGWVGQLGLEEHPDQYVDHLLEVFAEVHRVLRPDGVLWLNLGDSYASHGGQRGAGKGPALNGTPQEMRGQPQGHRLTPAGFKRKDMLGIPWTVALALRDAGWYLRSDIVWEKPNAMPESVTDRPTTSHEYLFMLAKSGKYFYDAKAIREPDKGTDHPRKVLHKPEPSGGLAPPNTGIPKAAGRNGNGRNKRTVWTIATVPYKGAHFATFPPKLIEPCILSSSRPGSIVLDPFAGVGTTLMVAVGAGRRALGIELNPKHVGEARGRIAAV